MNVLKLLCSALPPALFVGISLADPLKSAPPMPARTTPAETIPAKIVFNRDIRPILSNNCFACHGPDKNKRQANLRLDQPNSAVIGGDVLRSELTRRIMAPAGDAQQMPPADFHKTLTPMQKRLLLRWIDEGALYQKHWSYEPPMKAPIPAGKNPVDFLIRKRLTEIGLKPSPEADRRTLIRRLSFDLIGLPPTPAEVTAFEQDKSPKAYENLVERLLASPHYGERMAQGWLDVVRFADTIGYHSDTPRNIWPYRDWVIASFNSNKRFDRFTREQLAGDLLPDANQETRIGSAFNRLLLTTEEGGGQPKDYEARYLTDRVRAVGTVWLGQTTGCAQCHDHKFDPIRTRDFYTLGAYFADIKEDIIGAREPGMLTPDTAQKSELARRDAHVSELQRKFDAPHPEVASAQSEWEKSVREEIVSQALWTALKPIKATAINGVQLNVQTDSAVLAQGASPDKTAYTIDLKMSGTLTGLRLEALPDTSLPSQGPGRAGNGNFVLTEVEAHILKAGTQPRLIRFGAAQASFEQKEYAEGNPYRLWNATSVIDGDAKGDSFGWAILPQAGQAQSLALTLTEKLTLSDSEILQVTLKQNHGDSHTLGKFRLSVTGNPTVPRPLTAAPREIADIVSLPLEKRTSAQTEKLHTYFKTIAPDLAPLRNEIAEATKGRNEYEATIGRCLVTVKNNNPRTVRILPRGNFMDESGEVVKPATPAFLPPAKGGTRLDLANWLVSKENPLTARTVVNRLWKQFFGTGLSKVLEDLGAQGEPPTNPELLDWLACEFRDSGWDTKHMVRMLVNSATYKQVSELRSNSLASTASKSLLARDPYNREFARQSRFRLDAEEVRDNALAVSGLLSLKIGGPSVKPYQPERYWENLNFPVRDYMADKGESQYRRGLYAWWQRSFLHPSMLAFDAPSREECTAERNRSNIPQQALVTLNDPTYVEAARSFGARILTEAKGTPEQRLNWAWRQTLQRTPTPAEFQILQNVYKERRAAYQNDAASAEALLKTGNAPLPPMVDKAELAAWMHVARTLLNLHETITRP